MSDEKNKEGEKEDGKGAVSGKRRVIETETVVVTATRTELDELRARWEGSAWAVRRVLEAEV